MKNRAVRATQAWIVAMQKEFGEDVGMKCFDIVRSTLPAGEDLAARVLFNMMSGEGVIPQEVTLTVRNGSRIDQKINCIKDIRALTGYGLKEAKDAFEAAYDEGRHVIMPISTKFLDGEDYEEQLRSYHSLVNDLESMGMKVLD